MKNYLSAQTFDEALRNKAREIANITSADYFILWYKSNNDDIKPYYFYSPVDFTTFKVDENVLKVLKTKKSLKVKTFEYFEILEGIYLPIFKNKEILGVLFLAFKDKNIDKNIEKIIKEKSSINEDFLEYDDYQKEFCGNKSLLTLKGIKKDYNTGKVITKVLKGVDLQVYEGEFLVLLGESGCGKTTLLNIIGGVDHSDEGEFIFNGAPLLTKNKKVMCNYRRNNIGYIFQNYNLMPNLNVVQNLQLIAELVKNPLKIDDVLKIVGLSDKTKNYPSELSGGQQQRVSIARALIKNPTLIIADEPTSALNYEKSIEVLVAMENIHKQGKTIIMASHNREICKMADRIVKMREGKLEEIYINPKPVHAEDLKW